MNLVILCKTCKKKILVATFTDQRCAFQDNQLEQLSRFYEAQSYQVSMLNEVFPITNNNLINC